MIDLDELTTEELEALGGSAEIDQQIVDELRRRDTLAEILDHHRASSK